jgi:hypothetical protein
MVFIVFKDIYDLIFLIMYQAVLMGVYPWIRVTVFSRRIKVVYKHGLRIGETSTNLRIHPTLKLFRVRRL